MAQLILDAKMSKAKKDSIRATLSHFVTDHDDWAHMSGGRARMLKFGFRLNLRGKKVKMEETANESPNYH